VPANQWGKWKTNLQLFGVAIILLVFNNLDMNFSETFQSPIYYCLQNLLLFIATILSVVSGVIYVMQINKKLNATKL
jgi:CDP-diacylglycerol--glycerol-3-phosphate 3-phosphatidyltransferase